VCFSDLCRGGYQGGGYRRHGGFGPGFAVGVGVGSGLGYGGYYDDYAYGYGPGYNSGYYDNSYAYMSDDAGSSDDASCAARFRSYDPASGTYLGYDGRRHPCP